MGANDHNLDESDGKRIKGPQLFLLLLSFLVVINGISLTTGAVSVDWRKMLDFMLHGSLDTNLATNQELAVLSMIRLPRIILANLAGAGLALSGAALQGLFRNPLADASLLGISSGAALGASIMIVCGSMMPRFLLDWSGGLGIPIAAFLGALLTSLIVTLLSRAKGQFAASSILLAGIAVNALSGAMIGLLSYLADDSSLRNLTFWSLGSLAGATWALLSPISLLVLPCLFGFFRQAARLNMLLLGESEAKLSGVDVRQLKYNIIALSSLCIGALVSVTGIIGFVGLVAPHMVRMVIGPDHRLLFPGSALMGALLLGFADLFARTLASPAELPIGLLTSVIGGPFFIWLMQSRSSSRLI